MQLEVTITHKFDLGPHVGTMIDLLMQSLAAGGTPREPLQYHGATSGRVVMSSPARKPRARKADAAPAAPAAPAPQMPLMPPMPTQPQPAPVQQAPNYAPQGATGMPSTTPGFDTAGHPLPGHNQFGVRVPQAPQAAMQFAPQPQAPMMPQAPAPAGMAGELKFADLSKAFTELLYADGGEAKAGQVLARFGVSSLHELKPEVFPHALQAIQEASRA